MPAIYFQSATQEYEYMMPEGRSTANLDTLCKLMKSDTFKPSQLDEMIDIPVESMEIILHYFTLAPEVIRDEP